MRRRTKREAAPSDALHSKVEREERSSGELTAGELLRWSWRQLTSMRTALILLLLLAVGAVPGSIIPQEGIDAFRSTTWREAHPNLTPIYEKLGLFNVYSSPWFAAIYVMLMISLIGCIVPRVMVYARGLRAQPPAAPRNLTRMSDSATYVTEQSPDEVVAKARTTLKRRYRIRKDDGSATVSAEKGYLREAGNLLFHLSIIAVLVGFAAGSLFGYKGGVIVVVGKDYGFTNTPQQYDDLAPGTLFNSEQMDPFTFNITDFDVEWIKEGPGQGMAKGFKSGLEYCEKCDGTDDKTYDLRVNHPLKIGSTNLFLIGHGYAPVVTIKDGDGNVSYSGPTIFLPEDASFFSFGVLKAPGARPEQLGIQGLFYPTFAMDTEGNPMTIMGDALNPLVSLQVWAGDLNLDAGPQSVYVLDTSKSEQVVVKGETGPDGEPKPLRLDMRVGETVALPDGLGSVSFDGVERWNKIQISKQPGMMTALTGVVLALLGLLGSLFIRPRRVWVRATSTPDGTVVEVAALDRSGGDDTAAVVEALVAQLQGNKVQRKSEDA